MGLAGHVVWWCGGGVVVVSWWGPNGVEPLRLGWDGEAAAVGGRAAAAAAGGEGGERGKEKGGAVGAHKLGESRSTATSPNFGQ